MKKDRSSISGGNNQILILLSFKLLIIGVDEVRFSLARDLALSRMSVSRADGGTNCVDTHVQLAEQQRIDLDANGGPRTSSDEDVANALDLRELLRQHR